MMFGNDEAKRDRIWYAKWMQTKWKMEQPIRTNEMQSHTLIINLMKISISLRYAPIDRSRGLTSLLFFVLLRTISVRTSHRSKHVNNKYERRIKCAINESCEKVAEIRDNGIKLPNPYEILNSTKKSSSPVCSLFHRPNFVGRRKCCCCCFCCWFHLNVILLFTHGKDYLLLFSIRRIFLCTHKWCWRRSVNATRCGLHDTTRSGSILPFLRVCV